MISFLFVPFVRTIFVKKKSNASNTNMHSMSMIMAGKTGSGKIISRAHQSVPRNGHKRPVTPVNLYFFIPFNREHSVSVLILLCSLSSKIHEGAPTFHIRNSATKVLVVGHDC